MNEQAYREAERALWQSYGLMPDERMVDVDGGQVRVLRTGPSDGEPIVFLAGSPNAGSTWAPLVAELRDHACVMIDRPGTGLSTAPSAADPRAQVAAVLDAVLDDAGLQSAHVVGSSLGGWWAFVYAITAAERVRSVTQLGAPTGMPSEHMPFSVRMMGLPGLATLMASMQPSAGVVKSMFKSIGHGPAVERGVITPALLDWYRALLIHTDTGKNEMKRDAKCLSLLSPRALGVELDPAALHALSMPITFVWGTADNYGGADVARACAGDVPGATLELLDGAGHLPWLDEPVSVGAHVRTHLQRRAQRAA